MAKSLLRSGNLDDYQAVGGGGQAVFESALQIRETLRLRKQQAMVDCLAIPQLNDNGDRVDWYSPIEGQAIAWKAADEETRSRALRYLASTFESAAALSRKSLQSGKTALQLFGSLLEKATQFPGENHVFLVNGKPVITFWGFVNLNENTRDDVLDCLRVTEAIPDIPLVEPEPEEKPLVEAAFSQADEPLLTSVIEPPKMPEEPAAPPVIVSEPKPAAPIPVAEAKELVVYRCGAYLSLPWLSPPSPRLFSGHLHPLTGPLLFAPRLSLPRKLTLPPCLNSPRICRCIALR